jgi:hypothetical protein
MSFGATSNGPASDLLVANGRTSATLAEQSSLMRRAE